MSNKKEKNFIASNRVVRHKLGVQAADVLAVLVYKYEYWKSVGKLTHRCKTKYFYISLSDLRAETCFSEKVIAKNIKILIEAGLVLSIRQGLGRPNFYSVDLNVIDSYLNKHNVDLGKWQTKIRENAEGSGVKVSSHKSTSVITEKGVQDVTKECATKNKNTKNKKTKNKNFTYQASLVDSSGAEQKLESLINDLKESHIELEQEVIIKEIFSVLCQFFKPFEKFKMSLGDADLIFQLGNSEIHIFKIIDKIFENMEHIKEGRKTSRFGNLFVGIDKMIDNHNKAVL